MRAVRHPGVSRRASLRPVFEVKPAVGRPRARLCTRVVACLGPEQDDEQIRKRDNPHDQIKQRDCEMLAACIHQRQAKLTGHGGRRRRLPCLVKNRCGLRVNCLPRPPHVQGFLRLHLLLAAPRSWGAEGTGTGRAFVLSVLVPRCLRSSLADD